MSRARMTLLLLLVPLSALWCWLCIHAPIFGWNNLTNFGDGQRFSLGHQTWIDGFVFDIGDRHVASVKDKWEAEPAGPGFGMSGSLVASTSSQLTVRLDLTSHSERRVVRSIERDFPVLSNFRIAAGRFVVADGDGKIQWLDVEDPNEEWHTLTNQPGSEVWLWVHPQLPVFRRTAIKPQPPSQKLPQKFTELYRFDAQGQLTLLGSWLNGSSGNNGPADVWFQGETIATCDLSGKFIELRSVEDGQLVKQLELSPPIDLTTQKFRFTDDLLTIESGGRYRYYCISCEKWLEPPWVDDDGWTPAALVLSPHARFALWMDFARAAAVITDPKTGSQLCQLKDVGERYVFLDGSTLISIDPWLGLTIRNHDLATGATLLTWRPFWWVLPGLLLAILAGACWIGAWLRMPTSEPFSAWLDLHLLLLVLMALIVLRIKSIGGDNDTLRMAYQHAIYLTSSFLFVAWAWLITGRESAISRLSHWLIVYIIVLGGLAQTLHKQTDLAWMGVALVTIPSLLALPIFLTARFRGWQWFCVKGSTQEIAASRPGFMSLRQIMLVTAIFALLSLAARPLMPGLAGMFQLQWPIWEAAGVTLSGLVALCLANSNHVQWKRLAAGIAIVVVLLLVADALALAIHARGWIPLGWRPRAMAVRHGLGLYATVFWLSSKLIQKK